jgi:UDP-N-acetylmuramoyl-L-alanyl-D-glutamate--2,6-diaminopimelate ligase
MSFHLESWLSALKSEGLWIDGSFDGHVETLTADSRSLGPGSTLFFARRGASLDGHQFVEALLSQPLVKGIVVDRLDIFQRFENAPLLLVRDSTQAMALAVKMQTGDPTSSAFCAAVTGTNGKTTTTFLLESFLQQQGRRVGRLGTIASAFEGKENASPLTTPDFSVIQSLFADFLNRGANAFVLEASSHALDQKRLLGLELDLAIFTNLTPEHLDYHRTMEDYYGAKKKLMTDLLSRSSKPVRKAVVPLDGAYGSRLAGELRAESRIELMTWRLESSQESGADWVIRPLEVNLDGTKFQIQRAGDSKFTEFWTPLVGLYNLENVAGVLVWALSSGMTIDSAQKALKEMSAVPGRLERVQSQRGFIFVDYAHTPDALENVLASLRKLCSGRLKVVFGCGGDRDRQKRAVMGGIAELYADEIFVTSDNPRTENPESIIQDILQGVQRLKPIETYLDRRVAIEKAVRSLSDKDVLVIAGKGHETYQILGDQKIDFDDRKTAREFAET